MGKKSTTHAYSITGIVIANEWDVHGNVTGVAIYADNEKIYWVVNNENIQALIKAIQKKVNVEGEIIQLPDGHERIDIKSLKVVKGIGKRMKTSSTS
jgi:hypothetical protein